MEKTLITTLADYASGLRYEDLPGEVVEKARLLILEHLGLACRGYDLAAPQVAMRTARLLAAPGAATIWIEGRKARAIDCVMANSVMMHSMLWDDFHPTSHTHIGVAVVPPAVTVAEENGLNGRDVLLAAVAGYEVEARVGVLSVPVFKRGFRPTSVFAFFGSTATVAKLMRLPAWQYKNALSFAGGVAGGTLQPWVDGTMEWTFQEAFACRVGIIASLLAQQGFIGSDYILEGARGINVSFAGTLEGQEATLKGLGEHFEIMDVCHKRFPAGGANQGSISVAWDLQHRHNIDYRKIRSIRAQIPDHGTHERMNAEYAGLRYQGPFRSLDQCVISKPFSIAAVLKNGELDIDIVRREQPNTEIVELAHKIHLEEIKGINGWNLYMDIEMEDGTVYHGDGSNIDQSQFYLNRQDAGKKFLRLASGRLGSSRAEQLLDLVLRLDELDSMAPIIHLMCPMA